MEKGYSNVTKNMFRYIDEGKEEEIDIFIGESLSQEYTELQSDAEVLELFGDASSVFTASLSSEDSLNLRTYTGFSHKEINALLRNNWNYEQHGLLTEERRKEYTEVGQEVEKILFRFPSLGRNIKVYRGVTLAQFRPYGIQSIDELVHMEGKYFYDSGFTSTSLVRNKSLYNTEAFQIGKRNIEIEYLIPESCHDGALLLNDVTSHYKTEHEYLINSSNLIRIISVNIDKEKNTAFLKAILVPKKIWDPNAVRYLEEVTQTIRK